MIFRRLNFHPMHRGLVNNFHAGEKMNKIFLNLFKQKYAEDEVQIKIIDHCISALDIISKNSSNFHEAVSFINSGEELLNSVDSSVSPRFEILLLTIKSSLYSNQKESDKGLLLANQAIEISHRTGQLPEILVRLFSIMGILEIRRSNWAKALQHLNEAYKTPVCEFNPEEFKIMLLNNIAGIYNHLGDFETSANLINRLMEHYKENQNWFLYCKALMNKGVILHKMNNFQESLDAFYEAKTIYEEKNIDDDSALGLIYNNLVSVKLNLFPDETAEEELAAAWNLENKYGKTPHHFALKANTIKSLVRRKDFDSAEKLYHEVLESISETDYNYSLILNVSLPAFKEKEDWKKVAEIQEQLIKINEKNFGKQLVEQQARFKALYEFEQSEKEKEIYRNKNIELEKLNIKLSEAYNEITAQKDGLENLNTKLQNMIDTKDRMFSVIAHDVRNPFQNLLTTLESLIEYYDDFTDIEKRDYLSKSNEMLSKLIDFFENLLEWARIQTDTIKMNITDLDLSKMIDDEIFLLKPKADAKRIDILHNYNKNIMIKADKQMMHSIMRNLINNAIKFSNPDSRFEIYAGISDNYTNIKVIDQGIGISEESIKKIFDPDILYSQNGTDKERGFGFGLVLTQEFVKKHNGKLNCVSSPGKGTTMEIKIPS